MYDYTVYNCGYDIINCIVKQLRNSNANYFIINSRASTKKAYQLTIFFFKRQVIVCKLQCNHFKGALKLIKTYKAVNKQSMLNYNNFENVCGTSLFHIVNQGII